MTSGVSPDTSADSLVRGASTAHTRTISPSIWCSPAFDGSTKGWSSGCSSPVTTCGRRIAWTSYVSLLALMLNRPRGRWKPLLGQGIHSSKPSWAVRWKMRGRGRQKRFGNGPQVAPLPCSFLFVCLGLLNKGCSIGIYTGPEEVLLTRFPRQSDD